MNTQSNPMMEVPVNTMLLRMAAPISIGMLSTFLFQIVDSYFVGKLGSNELAALAFSSSAFFLFAAVFMGFSVGVSAVIARAVGSGERQKAKMLTMVSLALVVLVAVSLSLAGRAFIGPTFSALGASKDILPLLDAYMGTLYLGLPLLMLGIVGSGAARAVGITKQTEVVFGIAGVINLVFDYLLIFGIGPFPELGLAGAAWATVLSFGFIFLGVMFILTRQNLIGLSKLDGALSGLAEILKFSLSTISMQMLVPTTGIFTTFLLADYGSQAVAAFGIVGRIESLALIGIFAVSMAVTPFIAQNFGAKEHERIDQAIIFAGKASFYLGILLFAVLALLGPSIATIFSDDPAVINFVSIYFKIVAVSYAFQGLVAVTVAIFNGLQMPRIALKIMLVRTFVLVFPLLFIGSKLGLWWILAGLAVGNILASIYAAHLIRQFEQKWSRPTAKAKPWLELGQDLRKLISAARS
ncbi:Multidrug export protein MepA [Pseudovibrio sp. W64]|uniref:MATE family efflux transporter n=1 Tax=Pseudovibrio sp. W64 TaxID=1735583 RepID=UPI0007AEB3AB|nr:MATE family efflux transporter [Pseudovibrio sp. W64]KZK88733.1 Multidrug export protein MepA [Pseudovibrio sp. W64]